tara:strand:+ start:62 stop:211 length:150 start_codon:yes stop_codon:yes gene_type:complete
MNSGPTLLSDIEPEHESSQVDINEVKLHRVGVLTDSSSSHETQPVAPAN